MKNKKHKHDFYRIGMDYMCDCGLIARENQLPTIVREYQQMLDFVEELKEIIRRFAE